MMLRVWRLLTWRPRSVMILNVHNVTPNPEEMTTTVSWSVTLSYPRGSL